MPDVEIKRGYEVLPDNNVRFGIRVINNSDSAVSDVEVILDYTSSLFELEGDKIQQVGTIPPGVPRTAKFILKPLGCVHKEEVNAIVTYKDHQWKKHVEQMRPKEIHCVCPFLKEKSIKRADFLTMSQSGYMEERGVNFEGIPVEKLVDFLTHTCRNRLYKVDEFQVEGGKILYLAGDALGEKAYYLLTAVVKESDGLAQVLLRASSDKAHGLTGFLNEILDNLRHLVASTSAREIGIIKKEQVINIIDSVVQRSNFTLNEGLPSHNAGDGIVKRAGKPRDNDDSLKSETEENEAPALSWAGHAREVEDESPGNEEEESGKSKKKEEETQQTERDEEQEPDIEEEMIKDIPEEAAPSSPNYTLMSVFSIIVILVIVYWTFVPVSFDKPVESTTFQRIPATTTAIQPSEDYPDPAPQPVITPSTGQKTFTNSVGIEFVLIPSGTFNMGSPSNEEGRKSTEGPVLHDVKIANPFYMGKYEVTQKQWHNVMGSYSGDFKGDNMPVEQISLKFALEFVRRLNEIEGTNKYRLPIEAEWEYAARAGTTSRYSFGDDESKLGDYGWYKDNSGGNANEAGLKKPNPWGLYDMHGNVWEMVQDTWHDDYSFAPHDGTAWVDKDGSSYPNHNVLRGGSSYGMPGNLRSATRDHEGYPVGFRIVRAI